MFIFAQGARAQDISFGIYPPISQIEAKAPADIKSPIFIENLSKKIFKQTYCFSKKGREEVDSR